MIFVILTNTFNPHMKPLADSLFKYYGNDFFFISKDNIDEERIKLGWSVDNTSSYLLNLNNYNHREKCKILIRDCNVLYFGANPDMFSYIEERIKSDMPILYHSERLFKHGILQFFYPPHLRRYINQRIRPSWQTNSYMLCASAFLPLDYKRIHANTSRMYKFGYFPKFKLYNNQELMDKKNYEKIKIICVGRFLRLKHFDHVLLAVEKLNRKYEKIELTIIGTGKEEKLIRSLIKKLDIKNVILPGSMSPDEVREHLDRSNIFVISSDKREGWGAVVNEAMNSGCAVVVSDKIGCAPYLINDGENGLLFRSGNIKDLSEKIESILVNKDFCEMLGRNAYDTIRSEWNPDVAAKRLIEFANGIENCRLPEYKRGPLSKAHVI